MQNYLNYEIGSAYEAWNTNFVIQVFCTTIKKSRLNHLSKQGSF